MITQRSGHPSAAGQAQDRESSPVTDQRSTTVPRNQPLKRRIKDGSEEDASKRVVNVRKRNKTMSTYDSYPWYCTADAVSASRGYTRSACPCGRPSVAGSSTWLAGETCDGVVRRLWLDWPPRGCLATGRQGQEAPAEPEIDRFCLFVIKMDTIIKTVQETATEHTTGRLSERSSSECQ